MLQMRKLKLREIKLTCMWSCNRKEVKLECESKQSRSTVTAHL